MSKVTKRLHHTRYSKVEKPIDMEQFRTANKTCENDILSKRFNRVFTLIALTVFGAFVVKTFLN